MDDQNLKDSDDARNLEKLLAQRDEFLERQFVFLKQRHLISTAFFWMLLALLITLGWLVFQLSGRSNAQTQADEANFRRDAARRYFQSVENRLEITTAQVKYLKESPDAKATESLLTTFGDELSSARSAEQELTLAEEATLVPKGADTVIKVFYATNRNLLPSSDGPVYGAEKGDRTRYGVCHVSIPKSHKMGTLETRSWIMSWKAPNPKKHIILQNTTEYESPRFYETLRSDLKKASSNELFIFVHGFANSFSDAARRTGQLSHDLGYQGVPVMYSWPSKGEISESDYHYDDTNARWTILYLQSFLREIAANTGAERINLVAHSMGNDIVGNAIAHLGEGVPDHDEPIFNDVVLTAPDVDVSIFRDQLVPAMKRHSKRLTLYASSNDRALAYSKLIHGGLRMAGDTFPEIVVSESLDSVDVSAVDTYFFSMGHSYFGSNRTIISDLFLLFQGSPPLKRNLLPRPRNDPKSWVFRP